MAAASNYVSVSRRPPDVEDYIDMMRRYRSWIIGPAFAGIVISVVAAFLAPDMYRSQAVMRIAPQKVSERLVPSEVSQHMAERLNQMEQDILSRGALTALINNPSLDLYKKEKLQQPIEDIVQDMRTKHIQIRILNSAGADLGGRMASAFSISFEYPDRYRAKQVVDLLVTKFMDQNVTVLRNNNHLTAVFLDDELKSAADKMNELSQKITKFKIDNQGKLPEQAQANITMMNSLQQQLSTEAEGLNRATNEKLMQESHLNGLQNDLAFQSQRLEDTVLSGGGSPMTVRNQRLVDLERNLSELQVGLSEARKLYRDDYPPIKNLVAKIENLQKQKADLEASDRLANASAPAPAQPTAIRVTNPQVAERMEALRNQIATVKTSLATIGSEIQARQTRIAELNRRVADYQARIEAAPLNEQQYAQLMGDYQNAKQQYDDFTRRKGQSDTAENMTEHQAGESLEVLDPASLPEQSFEPNRPMWVGLGTVVGLLVGLALAAGKEMKDTSLKNLKDVRAYTNLPVLSSIPLLENALLVRRKRRLFWLAWSTAFIVGSIAITGAMYYHFYGRA